MQRPMMSPAPFRAKPGMPQPGMRPGMRQMPKGGGKPFLADGGGGLGVPEPIGGPAAMPPPAAAGGKGAPSPAMDPDQDGDMDSPGVKPEALHYHDDLEQCQNCLHMGEGQQCDLLKMQVSPEGACVGWEAQSDQGAPTEGAQPGEDTGDTGMGTSGAQ